MRKRLTPPIHFKNHQWAVTGYGMECCQPSELYHFQTKRLTETTTRDGVTYYDWPIHLGEKEWVDLAAFNAAFAVALTVHAGKYQPAMDPAMLKRSTAEAVRRRTRGTAPNGNRFDWKSEP